MPRDVIVRSSLIVLVLGLCIFTFFLLHFSEEERFTLFFLNKALARTSLLLIGTSFLLGPLCKIIPFLKMHLYIRRYFGLGGFFLLLAHISFSLLQLSSEFPLEWYLSHIWGVLAAIFATSIFLVLAVISSNNAIKSLGGARWKTMQRTGYIGLLLALIHIYFASSSRWNMWFSGEGSMPYSFVVFVFGIVVLLARLIALVIDKKHQYDAHNTPHVTDTTHHGL